MSENTDNKINVHQSLKQQIISEAREEVNAEQIAALSEEYKTQLRQVKKIEKMLANAKRELGDVELKISLEVGN